MSTANRAGVRNDGLPILPPYTPDHRSAAYRRGRIAIIIVVSVFCLFYGFAIAMFMPWLIVGLLIPLATGVAVIIWALPDTPRAPTRLVAPLLYALILLLVMWPNYIAIALPGLPWITMERLDGVPLLLIVLVCASTSPDFRSDVARALKASPYVSRLFVAFLVIQTLSIFVSRNPLLSVDRLFVAHLGWTAVFFASVYVFLKPGRAEKMAIMLCALGVAVGLIAVQEWRVQHVLWAGHIPSFLQIADPAVARTLAGADRFGVYRAVSTFGTPLGLGEFMALIMPLSLHYLMTDDYKPGVRLWGAVLSAFFVMVAVLSGARVGTLGCLVALTVSVAVWTTLKWRQSRDSLAGPAVAVASAVLGGLFVGSTLFIGRLHAMFWGNGSQTYSDDARSAQWKLGIPKILHQPWGYGIGMGGQALNYRPHNVLSIDNYYLSIALDYGIIGFILYYGMFLSAIYYGMSMGSKDKAKTGDFRLFIPIATSLITFVIVKSSFSEQSNHPVVFMMLGMMVALVFRSTLESAKLAPQTVPVAPAPRRDALRPRPIV